MRVPARFPSLAAAAVAALLLAACGGGDGTTVGSSTPSVEGDTVRVVDNGFEPDHLEVPAGGSVTWVWEGSASHDVVGDDFDSGIQREGTFSHTFTEPGTYDYRCTLHGGMTGRVTVAAP